MSFSKKFNTENIQNRINSKISNIKLKRIYLKDFSGKNVNLFIFNSSCLFTVYCLQNKHMLFANIKCKVTLLTLLDKKISPPAVTLIKNLLNMRGKNLKA